MQLEDYFDFLSPTDIRLKGHRIGIDTVLSYYWMEIFRLVLKQRFCGLTLKLMYDPS
jgi:hypothetical protein